MTDMKQSKQAQTACYRSLIKNLSDQAGIMDPMELSRALVEIAFHMHPEATAIKIQELELRRVK